jgi:hypothetical protein
LPERPRRRLLSKEPALSRVRPLVLGKQGAIVPVSRNTLGQECCVAVSKSQPQRAVLDPLEILISA